MPHVQTHINRYGYCNIVLYHEIIESHNNAIQIACCFIDIVFSILKYTNQQLVRNKNLACLLNCLHVCTSIIMYHYYTEDKSSYYMRKTSNILMYHNTTDSYLVSMHPKMPHTIQIAIVG